MIRKLNPDMSCLVARALTCLGIGLILSACAQTPTVDVRDRAVPTAMFVFFDRDQTDIKEDARPVLDEAAAFLTQYPNTQARVVGHLAPDEAKSDDPKDQLDAQRVIAVMSYLFEQGVTGERVQPANRGRAENMSTQGTEDIDRRVDILFATQ